MRTKHNCTSANKNFWVVSVTSLMLGIMIGDENRFFVFAVNHPILRQHHVRLEITEPFFYFHFCACIQVGVSDNDNNLWLVPVKMVHLLNMGFLYNPCTLVKTMRMRNGYFCFLWKAFRADMKGLNKEVGSKQHLRLFPH